VPEAIKASSAHGLRHRDEVARQADVVFIMVPDTPDVEPCCSATGRGQACRPARRAGKVMVDMSSISPMATKAFAAKINALGATTSTRRSPAAKWAPRPRR
jgi:3-hydroxyisobutyrate dehydrogenase-like beta-hydroxyacid dehydrogenase